MIPPCDPEQSRGRLVFKDDWKSPADGKVSSHGNMDTIQKTSLFKPHIIELKHHVEADLANFTPVATGVQANL